MSSPPPSLRVFGVPALHGPDGEPITFRTRKHFALLIYLALEPQVHRREKLGALLWPGASTSEARHSLATGLSVLRAKLGRAAVETTRDTARLVPGSIEIDLDRLARGDIHATETTPALAVAPLLQEFVVQDAAPWDHWRDGLSAKWNPAIKDALLARIERSRRQGNTRAMEVLADALLLLDDLSEEGVRAKMESRAFAGDRLTALQIYENWRVRLADELGAQPSELVAGMALRLRRRGWERTSSEHIPAVRTDQWKDRPFVGRAKEYEALYEGWEGCQRGASRHALLTGESGIGKSTLMERLTTAAGLQGAVASRVQCHEVEREIPYGAIGALITMLLEHPGATSIPPEWLSELGRTVSGVRRRFPNVAPPIEATGEMVRIRLADALHELVRAISEEHPLILAMDDIHLGDDASVAVMHLLLRRLSDERVLVFCTLRQSEGPLGPSARGMLDRADLANMRVVPLPPLTDAESMELLGQLVPGEMEPPPATVRRALLRAAAGLPMLLELLLRDWMGHGDRCVALAVQAMTEEPGAAGGAGETYRRLLDRLTLGLDPTTRSVLNLAAVLGSQLNEFELYSLVDLTLAQAMAGLSQLAALRILRDGGRGLEFANEVMRGEAYFAVPSSVRKVLHSKVADRLIERAEDGEEMLGLAIAWHCIRSGRVPEAGEWLIKGGKEATARSALAEAEEALESGLRHLPSPFRDECGHLLVKVLVDQSRYDEAHALAQSIHGHIAWDGAHEHSELLALTTLARTIADPSRHALTLTSLLEVTMSASTMDSKLRAASLATTVVCSSLDPAHCTQALPVFEQLSRIAHGTVRNRVDLMRAQVLFWMRRTSESERILERLSQEEPDDGPHLYAFNLSIGLGACCIARGQYSASLARMERARAIAVRVGSPRKELAALSNLAIIQYRLGRLGEAFAHSLAARRVITTPDHSTSLASVFGVALCTLALTEQTAEFTNLLHEATTYARSGLSDAVAEIAHFWIADALWLAGDRRRACSYGRRALQRSSPRSLANAGLEARWTAIAAREDGTPKWEGRLIGLLNSLNDVDELDKYEIASACMDTLPRSAWQSMDLPSIAVNSANILPAYTIAVLRKLGFGLSRSAGSP